MVTILKRHKNGFFSIRGKIVLTYLIIILTVILVISVFLITTLTNYLIDQRKLDALTAANMVSSVVSENFTPEFVAKKIPLLMREKNSRTIIVDNEATVIFDSYVENSLKDKTFLKPAITNALRGKGKDTAGYYKTDGDWYIEVGVPVIKNTQPIGAIYMLVSGESTQETVLHIRNSLWMLSVLIFIVVGIFAASMARILTMPVEKLTRFINNMPKDSLEKTEVTSRDEIGQLALAFNQLIDRLAELEEKRKSFVSDASHELKTPLSIIKLISDSLMQTENPDPQFIKEFLTDMNNEIERLGRIIERLLNLTKLDSHAPEGNLDKVDLIEVVDEVYRKLLPFAESKQISFVQKSIGPICLPAQRDVLTQAIYNITDNSIKYTEEGGSVSIEVTRDLGSAFVTVTDTGIGIPKEEQQKIFDRFYRVDKARARDTGGTGLGLAIAVEAVTRHNGHIEVVSEEDKGSKFIIVLPFEESQDA